jgi:hypothetical protein
VAGSKVYGVVTPLIRFFFVSIIFLPFLSVLYSNLFIVCYFLSKFIFRNKIFSEINALPNNFISILSLILSIKYLLYDLI